MHCTAHGIDALDAHKERMLSKEHDLAKALERNIEGHDQFADQKRDLEGPGKVLQCSL